MIIQKTDLDPVLLIKPKTHRDDRGEFVEVFREHVLHEAGISVSFVQDNVSKSKSKALRGLHYQLPPASQLKLVMAVSGTILDVVVDMRQNSPTFKQHYSAVLSDENRHMIYVPTGFAHGFSVLSDEAIVYYKCNDYYSKDLERGVRWNDPELDIDWNISDPVLSEKDGSLPLLKDIDDKNLF